jgi:hypothetical protein
MTLVSLLFFGDENSKTFYVTLELVDRSPPAENITPNPSSIDGPSYSRFTSKPELRTDPKPEISRYCSIEQAFIKPNPSSYPLLFTLSDRWRPQCWPSGRSEPRYQASNSSPTQTPHSIHEFIN